uniref:Tyrosine-protein kinase n=1 Tax=Ascaris lumbricoides TaxID=6252 RepID=A0A9J2Q677_ASCLU
MCLQSFYSSSCTFALRLIQLLSIKKKSSYSGDVLSEKTQSAMGESNQTRKKKSRTSPECLAATTDPKDKESEAFKAMGKAMTHNIWYHGLMPRDEVEDLLRRDGDFVFLGKPKFTLSVSNKQRIRHILFKCENNEWFFRDAHPEQMERTWAENIVPFKERLSCARFTFEDKGSRGRRHVPVAGEFLDAMWLESETVHFLMVHVFLIFDSWHELQIRRSTPSELIEAHLTMRAPVQSDGTILERGIPRPEFYILHEHIEIIKKLGGGAFGEVYTGIWKKKDGTVEVAVKTLKGIMHKKQRAEFMKAVSDVIASVLTFFVEKKMKGYLRTLRSSPRVRICEDAGKYETLQEAKLMKRFDHKNIVRLYGVAPQEEPIMIILEYAAGGSLKSHLQKDKSVTTDRLVKYVIDAARGMCYLSGRQVIHRDIAARNCLLGKADELKIADFGLSVADISLVKQNKLKSMPVRWLSPETLRKGEFSKKTDVWSFGVLTWEIFMRCASDPFPRQTTAEAKAKV